AAGRAARQPARVRGDPRLRAGPGPRTRRAHAHARHPLSHDLRGGPMKWGHSSFPGKRGQSASWLLAAIASVALAADHRPDFTEDFEEDAAGPPTRAPSQ